MKEADLVIATGSVDLQGEQILPEAFEELARSLSGAYLPMAWQHDPRIRRSVASRQSGWTMTTADYRCSRALQKSGNPVTLRPS